MTQQDVAQTDYELVAAPHSYYSAKIRSCLQYKRIPYQELGCNIETLGLRVTPATGDHLFPVVFCPDGEILKDGCDIVEGLERRHPERPVAPEDPQLKLIANILENIADNNFAMAMIYYRWIPEETKAWGVKMFNTLNTKGVTNPDLLALANNMSGTVSAEIQSRLPKVSLDRPEVQQEAIKVVEKVCDLLDAHFAQTPFVLGDRPCSADFGIMNAMWGHLFLDPCDASMYIRQNCIHLTYWISNMQSAAGISDQGELYLTDTMKELLQYLGSAFGHMTQEVLKAANKHIPELPLNEAVETGLGSLASVETFLLDVPASMEMDNYTAWRLQRVVDDYQAMNEQTKSDTEKLLNDIGFGVITQYKTNWRLEKKNFKLVAVTP